MGIPELKVYAVSISACQKTSDLKGQGGMYFYEHSPLLLTSNKIENAAEQARWMAFDRWKSEDGWFMHSAAIIPMDRQFAGSLLSLFENGLSVDDGNGRFIRFDNTSSTDFDNEVSTILN